MKKYFFGIVAAFVAICLSAFTPANHESKTFAGEKWFKFNGVDPTDLNNPSKYSLDGDGSAPTVCTNKTQMYRCEIHAIPQTGSPSLPDLSTINNQTKRPTP